jgi:tetratricopeptide (TPR) repeat protein
VVSVLRISDHALGGGLRRVTVRLEQVGKTPLEAVSTIKFSASPDDDELVRWYLEDYAEYPDAESTVIAQRAEARLAAVGVGVFERIFPPGGAARVWTLASSGPRGLADVRVEVDADPRDTPGVPWELLREPGAGQPLVLAAGELVRTHLQARRAAELPDPSGERLRVLLVICRPDGASDVRFRSVASRLVKSAGATDGLDLDVLRPATFERLSEVLREAAGAGSPYHVVHFDGHGAFVDVKSSDSGASSSLTYSVAGPEREGRHGYLVFENAAEAGDEQQLVDGPTLAALLVQTGVPMLLLNACRSAYAEAASTPGDATADVDDQVRAYGSLATEVAHAGVPGVVAMRYNVYVDTAAQFVADVYAQLLGGATIGQAATAARKALAAQPVRHIAGTAVSLQDWAVPTVYEAAALALLASQRAAPMIEVQTGESQHQNTRGGEVGVPRSPDVGFFGRDETLLALDRAFDTHSVVLLRAYAGAGKSTTAAEFARWYQNTGGLDHGGDAAGVGPIVWTSFEHHLPLPRVLDGIGPVFTGVFEARAIHWAALTDDAVRRDLVLQALTVVPILWVWDNVEPVTGFPAGTPSAWSAGEQGELLDFLRDVSDRTRARVLLTSRRDETGWLGPLATRVRLPGMPMRERLQLAHALAERHGSSVGVDWRPLLRFTGGNPLTITVAVGQALRENATTGPALSDLIGRIQAGHTSLTTTTDGTDDSALGRDKSLAASLDYGFTTAFTTEERAQLAVLHLFRDTVDVDALQLMGEPGTAGEHAVPVLAGLTREGGIVLLDRAAEVGLLTPYGGGYYGIHPALPWYFTTLYRRHHPSGAGCELAYLHALAALGRYYHRQVEERHAAAITATLQAEEANLRHALDLARTHRRPGPELGCLQGLQALHDLTGRAGEWARLVQVVTPDYLDPVTHTPHPGRQDRYTIIMQYRVWIARQARDWPAATTLQTAATAWNRQRAEAALTRPAGQLTSRDRHLIRNLAVTLQDLAELLVEQDEPACLPAYREALDLAHRIEDTTGEANLAGNLGNAYLTVTGLRDLDQAQHWHQRGLDLTPEHDRLGRAAAHGQLASVAYQRFLAARDTGAEPATQLTHLNDALTGSRRALDLTPAEHHEYLATIHTQLGNIHDDAGDPAAALRHYQQSITHDETRGDTYGAGQTRYNIAALYAGQGRYGDALVYARAAHANYTNVGPGAASAAAEAQRLIEHLEEEESGRN